MLNSKDFYAIIPNKLFSIKDEKGNYRSEGSILYQTAIINKKNNEEIIKYNDKILPIIFNLLLYKDNSKCYRGSIDLLIKDCNYVDNKTTRKEFKETLNLLAEKGFITIEEYNKTFIIDVEGLEEEQYVCIYKSEFDYIKEISKDTREFNSLFRMYVFIKLSIFKRGDGSLENLEYAKENLKDFGREGKGVSQTRAMDYDYIHNFTNISDTNKIISKLKENGLTIYDNVGLIINPNDNTVKESKNVYTVTDNKLVSIPTSEDPETELKEGLEEEEKAIIEEGFKICKDRSRNNRQYNGLKGIYKKLYNQNKLKPEQEMEFIGMLSLEEINELYPLKERKKGIIGKKKK